MSDGATQTSNGADFATTGTLADDELELLPELVRGLRTIRYGSIVVAVHGGGPVEMERLGENPSGQSGETQDHRRCACRFLVQMGPDSCSLKKYRLLRGHRMGRINNE
jgi:hypothetical protein